RRVLYLKLEEYISSHKNTDQIFAVVFMDINNFKMINDSLGHQAGNELLKIFANRLKNSIGPQDFVGRIGGDEFIIIFPNLTYKSDVEPIIKKIVDILQEKIQINDRAFILKSSIGVSFFPCDSEKTDKLIAFADMAMYKAKEKKGTVLYQSYFPKFSIELANKHHMGQNLKSAIINNAFYLVFQPIYSIVDKDWVKVEVLLRWRDHVGPEVFIPLASEIGLMPEIGLWVLEQACKVRLELAKISNKPIKFSINISAEQIQSSDDINLLIDAIKKYKCPPEWLEFELTESLLFDMAKADNFIKKIRSLGISVAIDDFGTGYSSFSYLKNLHFDTIKIDKQFVNSIFSNSREMSLVLSIIEISHSLNAQITVEGVETKEHFDFCVQQGCHYVQGYYIAKPCDLSSLIDKLSTLPQT
ncbi:MAG: bifunctional diguanylate cyclase/phosphodiesterase, partial [Legionella sp.]